VHSLPRPLEDLGGEAVWSVRDADVVDMGDHVPQPQPPVPVRGPRQDDAGDDDGLGVEEEVAACNREAQSSGPSLQTDPLVLPVIGHVTTVNHLEQLKALDRNQWTNQPDVRSRR